MTIDEMVWDLSQLVKSTDPTSIRTELESVVSEAEVIRSRFHGKIEGFDAQSLVELLETRDSLHLKYEGVIKYCNLMYSADSTKDLAKSLNDAARKAFMQIGQALAFVEIELAKLLARNPSLVATPVLGEYRHYLERIVRKTPHMLSEAQERLIIIKDRNGVDAWQLLQSDWLSTRTFDIEIDGQRKTLPYGEMVGLYESTNRDLRKRANQTVYDSLGKDEIIWASALRAVCEDHLEICKLRKYLIPMTQSLIANDVEERTITSLLSTVEKNAGLYQRYLKLKARLMGLDNLANYDVVAPLPNSPATKYSWRKAREMVVSSYEAFDEEMGKWVEEMFAKRHIDGKVRRGKESGAFCTSWLAGKSAYILQSFNEKMGDVYTQAHELGHAIHAYLGSRAQKPTNYDIGSCIAETGSTFGELLLTERLLSEARTKEEKQAILAHVLDEFGMAVFQVSARAFFEQRMYDAISQGQFLDGETVAKLWVESRDKIYGDSVDWLDVMKWEWTMKSHYYLANYRFYNYPYVFAQLFVFALYRVYKEQGSSFASKLKKLLAAGSSKSPRELAAELGLDLAEEEFWEKGMEQARSFIEMLAETL